MNVLIIGTGLTGMMAAAQMKGLLASRNRNAGRMEDEIQIELVGDGAGASPFVHGFNIPLDERDSVETFLEDTMRGGYGLSEPELAQKLCRGSLELLPDLEKLGISLEKKDGKYVLLQPLGSSWPRVAGSGNHTGAEILNRLTGLLKSREDVRFTTQARVLRLDVRDGCLKGAVLWDRRNRRLEYRSASCALIACGGFCGIYPFSTNPADSGGDGIGMAYDAGVPLIDMEFVQFEPSVALYPETLRGKSVITTMFYEGALLQNGKGERFMQRLHPGEHPECVSKDVLSRAIYEEIRKGNTTPHGGVWFDATGVGKEKLGKSYGSYVERYRRAGMDISQEPFEIAPGPHTSLGGIAVETDMSTAVPGIYAAGEAAGGIHGANRIGGNAGLETLVFGKLAGEGMLRFLNGKSVSAMADTKSGEKAFMEMLEEPCGGKRKTAGEDTLSGIRKEMQEILQKDLYLERDAEGLEAACRRLEMLSEALKETAEPQSYERLRLENDLTCALVLAASARARTGSVGCHVRSDDSGEDWHYHVFLQKKDGSMTVRKEKI